MEKNLFIPLMIPDIQQQDIDAVTEVLQSGMLIQGKKVEALEEQIAAYLGVKHAIAVSNGTATLHLALIVLGIGPGDEVIVPALSYVATANVVELVGATPVFVDIELETFNINPNLIEAKITSRTKAIIPVHEFGLACNLRVINELAKKHQFAVIEDAACALGAKTGQIFAGTSGDLGSFSFHPRKAITSGEGGLLVTNNEALASQLRILRNHGIDARDGKMNFVAAGFNYRMTDIQAALVLSQFQRFEQILSSKQALAEIYFKELQDTDFVLPTVPENYVHTWQSFHVLVPEHIDRDSLIQQMKEEGVGVNLGAQCIPNETFYQRKYQLNCADLFPNALKANRKGLVLPLYERLNGSDLKQVCIILKQATNG
ncbi:DegT/DnrJ/EryC1/StrS family aminotransferase [Fluviicola taffensis]|uniref:Glutamine--scyllo-inositol transaminase n=1 Tax=Fluviicola taffensis (strain DSM 16823 / NCIMB 13979 / RW262) TaxID=755732 RepID=F2II23_FLUTR|nr:DegT/DnrJ/EryC1/StrS family aminotransferase [Fluviicola taffensis]AEA42723.1 Glutamine--scyllo-inositol transaminase [Fluviicola taffensis DSM 16823]